MAISNTWKFSELEWGQFFDRNALWLLFESDPVMRSITDGQILSSLVYRFFFAVLEMRLYFRRSHMFFVYVLCKALEDTGFMHRFVHESLAIAFLTEETFVAIIPAVVEMVFILFLMSSLEVIHKLWL